MTPVMGMLHLPPNCSLTWLTLDFSATGERHGLRPCWSFCNPKLLMNVLFSLRDRVKSPFTKRSRWHISNVGLVRTQDSIGDALAAALRDFRQRRSNAMLDRWVQELELRLRDYEEESRLLIKLAHTGRVVKTLQEAVKTTLDLLGVRDADVAIKWQRELLQERDARIATYEAMVARSLQAKPSRNSLMNVMARRTSRQLEDLVLSEEQEVETLTLLKHGLEEYADVLTWREKNAMAAVFSWLVQRSGVVVVTIPSWFTMKRDDRAEMTSLAGGEERCLRQVVIWSELQHPNIRRFYGACHVGERFVNHEWSMPLQSWRLAKLPWRMLHGCALGLEYLSEHQIAHESLTKEVLHEAMLESRWILSGLGLQRRRKDSRASSGLHNDDLLAFGTVVLRALAEARGSSTAVAGEIFGSERPGFLSEREWGLIREMCAAPPRQRLSMTEILFTIDALANEEETTQSNELEATQPLAVESITVYEFPLAGRTIGELLQDTRELCDEGPEVLDINRLVYNRLRDIYDQVVASPSLLPSSLLDEYSMILWRFHNRLEQQTMETYNQAESLCASRSIANRNYGIQFDIDRLVLKSPEFVTTKPIHQWKPKWERQNSFLQARLASSRQTSIGAPTLPRWFIPPYQVEMGTYISEGSYGSVYRGWWLSADVVIKQVLTDQTERENREQFRQEVTLWFSLNHRNLIKLFGACHEGQPFFVCEHAAQGTITSFAKGRSRKAIWRAIYYAAMGLEYLHERNIVHGDLKGNNILVGKDEYETKLADFGLSALINRIGVEQPAVSGAVRWKAPECLLGALPSFASDIYSFGMCIIEVISGEYPWGRSLSDEAVRYHVVGKKMPPRPAAFEDEAWDFVTRMCCFDPEERVNATSVVQMALTGIMRNRHLSPRITSS